MPQVTLYCPSCSGESYQVSAGGFDCAFCDRTPMAIRPFEEHRWNGCVFSQCVKCGAFERVEGGLPCDPSRLAGQVEPCCECGEDYPAADLIAGHIFCPGCRPVECPAPPPGWRCTRGAGHGGPCAAVPDGS